MYLPFIIHVGDSASDKEKYVGGRPKAMMVDRTVNNEDEDVDAHMYALT